MKNSFNTMFANINRGKFNTWIDRLKVTDIFIIWIGSISFFGLLYFFLATNNSLLLSSSQKPVTNILDHIYFSFITATSTGFGDIVPSGSFKLIAILEVIMGVLLLAFVISKIVSIKQDIILSEIYEISFNERINRLRSSLLLFRQHIIRIINKIETRGSQKRELDDIYIDISSLEDILHEILIITRGKRKRRHFTKVINPTDMELILNSLSHSFSKLNELLSTLNEYKINWKNEALTNLLNRCIRLNNFIYTKLKESKRFPQERLKDLITQNKEIIKDIKEKLN